MNKTFGYALFFFACTILSINAARSITESYTVGSVYVQRKAETQRQYLELIKKKNELDYISSPFFIEKQLRESLKYYRQGEKLLVFTKPLEIAENETFARETESLSPTEQWKAFLLSGVLAPYDQ